MKQLGEITVGDYMTPQATVVNNTARLTEAIRIMDDHGLSVAPVVDEQGELVGILSNRDLIGIMHEIQADLGALHHVEDKTREFLLKMLIDQGDGTLVMDVMSTPVETITSSANLVVAAQRLNESEFHLMPVVDEYGVAMGVLSTSDFVRAIAENGALAAG